VTELERKHLVEIDRHWTSTCSPFHSPASAAFAEESEMSDWLRDLAIYIMPFAVLWLVCKTERLGRQIEASTKLLRLEIIENDEEREREPRVEFETRQARESGSAGPEHGLPTSVVSVEHTP
jgi:hypothetical protein